jgi:hypothetical protein
MTLRLGATLPKDPNMDHYRQNLHPAYPHLWELKITVRPMALAIVPWQDWNQNQNPDWWRAHQKVKHHRDQHLPGANLENVLHSAAGLLVFLTYWYQPELYKPEIAPGFHVFQIEGILGAMNWVGHYELKDFGPRIP